jgi:hypothetical protein
MGFSAPYYRRNAQCKIYVTGNRAKPILMGNMISPIRERNKLKLFENMGLRNTAGPERDRERERERERGIKRRLEETAY